MSVKPPHMFVEHRPLQTPKIRPKSSNLSFWWPAKVCAAATRRTDTRAAYKANIDFVAADGAVFVAAP